eukprot:gene4205-4899_t
MNFKTVLIVALMLLSVFYFTASESKDCPGNAPEVECLPICNLGSGKCAFIGDIPFIDSDISCTVLEDLLCSQQTTVYAGGNDTVFEVPPTKAYNFAKSWFQFTFQLPATVAAGPVNKFGFAFADFIPFFRQIQVVTRGGFGADAAATPGTNPVPLSAPGAAFNVQNMEKHLAVEKNLQVIQDLQAKIHSPTGFSVWIPYCYQNQFSLNGNNQSVTLRVNRQNGKVNIVDSLIQSLQQGAEQKEAKARATYDRY